MRRKSFAGVCKGVCGIGCPPLPKRVGFISQQLLLVITPLCWTSEAFFQLGRLSVSPLNLDTHQDTYDIDFLGFHTVLPCFFFSLNMPLRIPVFNFVGFFFGDEDVPSPPNPGPSLARQFIPRLSPTSGPAQESIYIGKSDFFGIFCKL